MFWDKRCGNCRMKIEKIWEFCPGCGNPLKEPKAVDMFQEIDKEFRQMDQIMKMKMPKFMLRPQGKARGVSITITSDNISPPKINVQTYGDHKHMHHHQQEEKTARTAKIMEEPDTKIEKSRNKQTITLNLPDVKNLDDIEIKQLSQSVEIRAFAGDKAYFKLIPIPSNASVNNEFKDGVLKIEVVK